MLRNEGFSYIPPFRAALMSLGINYSVFHEMVSSAKESRDFDYIIVDADTVLDGYKTKLMDMADKVIIVTSQSGASVFSTNILVSNISGANSDKYIYICNNFCEDEENMLVSPDVISRFSVNDYIKHIPNCEKMKARDLAVETEIQKISFLIT